MNMSLEFIVRWTGIAAGLRDMRGVLKGLELGLLNNDKQIVGAQVGVVNGCTSTNYSDVGELRGSSLEQSMLPDIVQGFKLDW